MCHVLKVYQCVACANTDISPPQVQPSRFDPILISANLKKTRDYYNALIASLVNHSRECNQPYLSPTMSKRTDEIKHPFVWPQHPCYVLTTTKPVTDVQRQYSTLSSRCSLVTCYPNMRKTKKLLNYAAGPFEIVRWLDHETDETTNFHTYAYNCWRVG